MSDADRTSTTSEEDWMSSEEFYAERLADADLGDGKGEVVMSGGFGTEEDDKVFLEWFEHVEDESATLIKDKKPSSSSLEVVANGTVGEDASKEEKSYENTAEEKEVTEAFSVFGFEDFKD